MEIYVVEFFVKDENGFIRKPVAYFEKNEAIKVARSFASKRAVAAGGTFFVNIDHSIGYEMNFIILYESPIIDIDVHTEVCRITAADFID